MNKLRNRGLICLMMVMATASAFALRHIGFETDAFNRAFPTTFSKNAVFSPASFEIDCAIIAESLDTIPKAQVSERLGVVVDFESSYRPVLETYATRTNGNYLVAARGFCVPEVFKASVAHRHYLERVYGVEVMPIWPNVGAESWFKATMDGEAEAFTLPKVEETARCYSFYDLISVSVAWKDPFPIANARTLPFIGVDGSRVNRSFMADVREVDAWENDKFTLLKLPLHGDAVFYALLPNEGMELSVARKALSSDRIDQLLAVTKSVTELGVYHGPAAVVLPKIEICNRLEISATLGYFKIPLQGLIRVCNDLPPKSIAQWMKFSLMENGRGMAALERKPAEEEVRMTATTKRFIFNRPFLFFVYHEPTATIPVAGQFTGKD